MWLYRYSRHRPAPSNPLRHLVLDFGLLDRLELILILKVLLFEVICKLVEILGPLPHHYLRAKFLQLTRASADSRSIARATPISYGLQLLVLI